LGDDVNIITSPVRIRSFHGLEDDRKRVVRVLLQERDLLALSWNVGRLLVVGSLVDTDGIRDVIGL
jgi:hypothetical protein